MKKIKQILAIIGITLLVGMYVSTIFFAIFDQTNGMRMLFASLVATIIIPVLIWTYTFIYKLLHRDDEETKPKE